MQNMTATMDHLKNHIKYPATKDDLVTACNNLSDFSKEDKEECAKALPDGTYFSAEEVMEALG